MKTLNSLEKDPVTHLPSYYPKVCRSTAKPMISQDPVGENKQSRNLPYFQSERCHFGVVQDIKLESSCDLNLYRFAEALYRPLHIELPSHPSNPTISLQLDSNS
jgi:hypothetical protein